MVKIFSDKKVKSDELLESAIPEPGFNCEICGKHVRVFWTPRVFPLCDECKKDLKFIVEQRREFNKKQKL